MPSDFNKGNHIKKQGNTTLGKKVIRLGNNQHEISDSGYENRKIVESITKIKVEDGRYLSPERIVGESWTGLDIPEDRFAECCNPFENHEIRAVYLGIDGTVTEDGNVLCTECYEINKHRQKLNKWPLVNLDTY